MHGKGVVRGYFRRKCAIWGVVRGFFQGKCERSQFFLVGTVSMGIFDVSVRLGQLSGVIFEGSVRLGQLSGVFSREGASDLSFFDLEPFFF